MTPDSGLPPEDDIQQALHQAQNPQDALKPDMKMEPGEVITEAGNCPVLGLRYALAKCGYMAQKYPWQATAAVLLTAGCTWMCSYFGLTVMVALVLFALYGEE